jgi:hypothetical protein
MALPNGPRGATILSQQVYDVPLDASFTLILSEECQLQSWTLIKRSFKFWQCGDYRMESGLAGAGNEFFGNAPTVDPPCTGSTPDDIQVRMSMTDTRRLNVALRTGYRLQPFMKYAISLDGYVFFDFAGNSNDPTPTYAADGKFGLVEFYTTGDTAAPEVLRVAYKADAFTLWFNEPIKATSGAAAPSFVPKDSSATQAGTITCQENGFSCLVEPDAPLTPETWYSVQFAASSVEDMDANAWPGLDSA